MVTWKKMFCVLNNDLKRFAVLYSGKIDFFYFEHT